MKTYQTPEATAQSFETDDIMTGSQNNYFQDEGNDSENLLYWGQIGQ